MSPRTEEQYEQIRENKKKLIMDAALEYFAREGYYTTTIEDITKHAGISKGLIYNYFKSKEELLNEIMLKGAANIVKLLDKDRDGILTEDEFKFFINETFKLIENNTEYWKLYFAILNQPNIQKVIEENIFKSYPILLKSVIMFFKFRNCFDPEAETLFFHALIDGICMNYISNPMLYPLEKMKSLIFKFYNLK